MPLDLKQLQSGDLLFRTQGAKGMLCEEGGPCILGAIEDDVDIFVPCFPRVLEQLAQLFLEHGRQLVTQPVEGCSQRSTPLLVPGMPTRIAAAVGAPALDPVRAAPRTILYDLDDVLVRVVVQKLFIIAQLPSVAALNLIHRIPHPPLSVYTL